MFTIVFDMTHIDTEWLYHVGDEEGVRRVVKSLENLGVEVVEVLHDGESMLWDDYQKILTG